MEKEEKTLKQKVATILKKAAEALETKEVKMMAQGTLQAGETIVTPADEWASGVEVFVISSEGENIPLAQGEYTLDDGSMIIVTQDGLVEEFRPVEMKKKEEKEEVEASEEGNVQEQQKVKSIVESVVKEMKFAETIEALKQENEALKTQLSAQTESQRENESVIVTLAEEIAELNKPAITNEVKHQDSDTKKSSKATGFKLSEIRKIKNPEERATALRQFYQHK